MTSGKDSAKRRLFAFPVPTFNFVLAVGDPIPPKLLLVPDTSVVEARLVSLRVRIVADELLVTTTGGCPLSISSAVTYPSVVDGRIDSGVGSLAALGTGFGAIGASITGD